MLSELPTGYPEHVDVLRRVGSACRVQTYEHASIDGYLRRRLVNAPACRTSGHPDSLRDHLVKGVCLMQGAQAFVHSRHAALVGHPSVIE